MEQNFVDVFDPIGALEKERKRFRIREIWNARLNPPDRPAALGNITWTDQQIDERNVLIDNINTALTDEARDMWVEELADFDDAEKFAPFKLSVDSPVERKEIEGIQAEMADQTYMEFAPVTNEKLDSYIEELAFEIIKERRLSGIDTAFTYSFEAAVSFVEDNLFANWDIHPRTKKAVQNEIPVRAGMNPDDIHGFQILDAAANELNKTPQHMTGNDKYWLSVDKSIERGIYPPEWKSVLLQRDDLSAGEAERLLTTLGLEVGTDPVAQLDSIAETWNIDFARNILNVNQDARLSGNVETFFDDLTVTTTKEGLDPSDVFPRIGGAELDDQALYSEFTSKSWNFTNSIEDNIKALMGEENVDFGEERLYSLNPNSNTWPTALTNKFTDKSIKGEVGLAQRDMIKRIADSPEGKAYKLALLDRTENPSLEESFAIYKAFKEEMGEGSQNFLSTVVTELDTIQDMDYAEDLKDVLKRETLAKEYLSRFRGMGDDYKKPEFAALVSDLMPKLFGYRNFDHLQQDQALADAVVEQYIEIVKSRPFSAEHDMKTRSGRSDALEDLLERDLNEEAYAIYQKAPEEVKDALRAKLGDYANESEALADPAFVDLAGNTISAGAQVIADKEAKEAAKIAKAETDAAKAAATAEENARLAVIKNRKTLNDNIGNYVIDDLRNRGIITADSSPEFVRHLMNNVVSRVSNRISFGGGIDAMDDLAPFIQAEVEKAPAFDLYESDFRRQILATDQDLPPGVRPSQIAAPIPGFDYAAVSGEMQEFGFERPEFARFMQQQMSDPEFAQQFKAAATPEVDTVRYGSALSGGPRQGSDAYNLQKDRLDSFQNAYDRAVSGGDEQAIERAEAALDRAKTQFSREVPRETQLPTKRLEELRQVTATYSPAERAARMEAAQAVPAGFGEQYQAALERERFAQESIQQAISEGNRGAQATYEKLLKETQEEAKRLKQFTTDEFFGFVRGQATTSGLTSRQFFERELPGFEKRFEQSPFFRMQEQRLKQQEEQKKRRAESEERAAESRRRGRLRGGAMTVFGRRE